MTRTISFPWMGKQYTKLIKYSLENLGLNIQLPPKTTRKTINLGVKNSAEMMCFPYKVTTGNLIEALDNGADTLLMYDNQGPCRFRHYCKLQELALKNLGYDFEIYGVNGKNLIKTLKKLSGKSTIKIIKEVYLNFPKKLKEYDEKIQWSDEKPNIGIIGEIFSVIDESVNYGIESKIKSYDANPFNTITLSDFLLDEGLFFNKFIPFKKDKKKKYKVEASKYLNGELGGHGFENIYNLLELIDKKIDGVIHIEPLTCFTEDTKITIDNFTSKPIKDIKIGDKVLTHKGRFRKASDTLSRDYKGKILKISCEGLLQFKVTPEHPILALERKKIICHGKKKPLICRPNGFYCKKWNGNCKLKRGELNFTVDFIESKKLQKGDFIAIPKPKKINKKSYYESLMVNPKKPKYKDIKNFMYNKGMLRLLGYYLAEGTITYDYNKTRDKKYFSGLRFTFNKKEKRFMEDIIKIIKDNNIDCHYKIYFSKKRTNTADLSISNRSLAYIFEKLCGKYCDKKEIHREIMFLNPKLQLELVKGFFRGDGCYENNKRTTRYRATTTSFKLANQLFWILIRNNIKATIRKHKEREDRKDAYTINISSINALKRLKEEIIDLPPRKFTTPHFLETNEYFLMPIKEIKKEDFNGKVYNLEVEEDNSYVASLLAVHNCAPEVTIEPIINHICKCNHVPLLRIPIDENNSEANLETRIETFIELIKMRGEK